MADTGLRNIDDRFATLLVWDAESRPPTGSWKTVLWRTIAGSASDDVVSLPVLVEANADRLRKQYLSWVYELGETRIRGRRLVDRLELWPGFSFWWMTLFAEKCNYAKSPQIDDAIRLMAFDNWITVPVGGHMILVTSSDPLAECLRYWCTKSGLSFERKDAETEPAQVSWPDRLYQFLPHPVQALIWLVQELFRRWPLRGEGLRKWRQSEGQITFISYLFNIAPEAADKGRFESQYWTLLPAALQRVNCKTNWLHLYIESTLIPNANKAAKVICQFNKNEESGQIHVTLDTFLGPFIVFKILRDWVHLVWSSKELYSSLSSSNGNALDLWPLYREDWCRSFSGKSAISNLLYCNLLESALATLPKQRVGVYLRENQGWEFALINAWKASGHERLIGAAHSTIRFWDLRYFFDPRSYQRTGQNDLPLPDQMAVNGLAARDACLSASYPERDLVETEALRYFHLMGVSDEKSSTASISNGTFRVLVLGDYLPKNTRQQMRLLEDAVKLLPSGVVITVKPHPSCPVEPADYPRLRVTVTMEPLSHLLGECNVAYTNNVTSAAVDAYCAGVPVVSVFNPSTLNLSPLRGRAGVVFVSTPEDLALELVSSAATPRSNSKKQEFFTLDANLPRWQKLLLDFTE